MGNAARKARKAERIPFEREQKTQTHRYRTRKTQQLQGRALEAAYQKLRRDSNATPPPSAGAAPSEQKIVVTTPDGAEHDVTKLMRNPRFT